MSSDMHAAGDRALREALAFIREHCREDLSVEQVARRAALNRRTLERRFQLHVGRSPHEQLIWERVEQAKRWLTETDLPISEIAGRLDVLQVREAGERVADPPARRVGRDADPVVLAHVKQRQRA